MGKYKHLAQVKFSFIGYHRWKNAPTEVDFLRNLHRHNFEVKISIEVYELDRELEYFMIQRYLKKLYPNEVNLDYKSCEMMSEEIKDYLHLKYGSDREVIIEILEDGENGDLCI